MTRPRWRVLLLIKCLGVGGAERLLVDVAARGDRSSFGYEAAYVLDSYNGLAAEMRETGTPVVSLGARADWDLRWIPALRRLVTERRYDLVHFHLPYSASLGRLVVRSLPRSSRPRTVYTVHCTWNETAAPVRMVDRATIGLDDALLVVSETARQALPESLRQRAQVVIHGVDPSRSEDLRRDREKVRDDVRRELRIPDDHVLALIVANLRPEKGYDVLMEAAASLIARNSPISFVSAGHGPLTDELGRLHDKLGLGDRFRFLGARSDALRLMAAADVFTLPSRHEALPVTVMEATSLGLPLIVTCVGELPRIFTDGKDAIVIPPGRPDLLARSLQELVDDPALRKRLGAGALERSAIFDVSSAVLQIEELYRGLLSRAPG